MRQMSFTNQLSKNQVWTTKTIAKKIFGFDNSSKIKSAERWIIENELDFVIMKKDNLVDESNRPVRRFVANAVIDLAKKKRYLVLFASIHKTKNNIVTLFAHDSRNGRRWVFLESSKISGEDILNALKLIALKEDKNVVIIPNGSLVKKCRDFCYAWKQNQILLNNKNILRIGLEIFSHGVDDLKIYSNEGSYNHTFNNMTHLDILEAESIHILREVVTEAKNPAMLYSIGKDSSVMLHLARKAFYPSPPPFPLLHVDTCWKFRAMYDFRDYMAKTSGVELLVHINKEGVKKNINPFDHGTEQHTHIMKTEGLKQALDHYRFDVTFGGARRDEEKSRAKERVFSFRTSSHHWDPKNQRPEIWHQYNNRINSGESIRVFPLSNWTELDIWLYIYRENIPIVPLYFAAERPIVERDGMMLMVDDDRWKFFENEEIKIKKVRFRTLGCYPLTGAIESNADNLSSILLELLNTKTSERQGRAIDTDVSSSMEKKKQEGYF